MFIYMSLFFGSLLGSVAEAGQLGSRRRPSMENNPVASAQGQLVSRKSRRVSLRLVDENGSSYKRQDVMAYIDSSGLCSDSMDQYLNAEQDYNSKMGIGIAGMILGQVYPVGLVVGVVAYTAAIKPGRELERAALDSLHCYNETVTP